MPCLNLATNWPSLSWILIRVRNRRTAILNFRRKSPDGEAAVTMSATEVTNSANPARDQYVVLHGYLKKLKTNRRRYFVLFRDGTDQLARLDYFESDKKFKARFSQPKRSIVLKSCFHINRRLDTKHKFVVALYTKDDCFCLVMDSEAKMAQWLKAMTELHRAGVEGANGSTYEHVWQVTMEKKGLAEERGIRGNYHLCLNEKMLSLVRYGTDRNAISESQVDLMEFPLSTIRRCGDSHCYFYMEVGRFSAIGSGELWMGTEDPLIAQNMHKTIIKSRLGPNHPNREREDIPPMRGRSCSANEASKPILMVKRRQTHVGAKPSGFSPVGDEEEDESDLCAGACCTHPECPSTPSTTCSSGGTVVTVYGRSPTSSIASSTKYDGIQMLDAALSASRTSTPIKVILAGGRAAPMAAFDIIDDEPPSVYMDIFRPSSDGSDSDSSMAPPSMSPAKPTVLVSAFTSALSPSSCNGITTTSSHARTASNHYKSKPWGFFRRHSVSAGSGSSSAMCATANTACHQRALSLPITSHPLHQSPTTATTTTTTSPNFITSAGGHHMPSLSLSSTTTLLPPSDYVESAPPPPSPLDTIPPASAITTTSYTIQPFHQRTRSLPLTEETAVQITLYHSNGPVVDVNDRSSTGSAVGANNCHCNVQPCRHANHSMQPTTTTISHFYNRNKQTHFELINDHHLINEAPSFHRRTSHNNNNEQTVPTMTSSMDSIVEDDDGSSSGDYSQENSMVNQLLSSMGAGGNVEMMRLMANNRLTGTARHSVSGCSTVAATGGSGRNNGGGCHHSPRSSALGRERCDSLPTRNRTTSETLSMPPPPPRIPFFGGRAHSTFPRQSNSPPLSSSAGPMSPSAGCSESEGSSLSIDETDGFHSHSNTPDEGHQFGSRHFNASETVIPEENLDECWMADNNKKNLSFIEKTQKGSGSLSLPIQSQHQTMLGGARKGSPAAPVSYMDRYSPCGSSPGDQQISTGGYMLMSPGADIGRSLYTNSSGASSLAEDLYVPSDPAPPAEEYVDMMESSNQRQHTLSEMSSAASSCSITSGTPSTDLRFGEYQLDKVVSIFTRDDEASLNDRPARAYSVGSRSEHNKRKLLDHIMPNDHKNSRHRAFSVGAKVPRSDAYHGMIQTAPLSSVQQKKDANLANNNLKSASVLTLSSSHKRTGSGSVIDPMDDLMEIDFTSSPSSSVTMEEDVCDSPTQQYSSSPLAKSQPMSVPVKKTTEDHHHVLSTGSRGIDPPNGYVPMRPTLNTSLQSNYIPMKTVRSPPYNSTAFVAPKSAVKSQSPVVASSPSSVASTGRNNNSVTASDDYLPMSPSQTKNLSAPEGYMEMGWAKNTKTTLPTRPTSTVTSNPNNNEPAYSRQLQDSRPISMPININQGKSNLNNERKNISLNLEQNTTNATTRLRCDSKDSGIVTPSGSHNAIFPFSPGSPSSQPPSFPNSNMLDENEPARKCLVDGTSGTLHLATDNSETVRSTNKIESTKILNTDVNQPNPLDGLSSDYADMSLGGSSTAKPTTSFTRKLSSARTTTNADYALMRPFPAKKTLLVTINNNLSNATAKTNQTGFRPISNLSSPSATSNINSGYELLQVRPNSVNSEKVVPKTLNTSNRPNSANSDRLTPSNVTTPTTSTTTSSSSSTSTLCGGGSKSQSPLSVQRVSSNESNDSQSQASASSRPPSVSSERELHYASLDLSAASSPASAERLEVDINLAVESQSNAATSDSSTSPNSSTTADSNTAQPPAFTYAQIDFLKSEQLKEAAKLVAAGIASQQPNTSC